jgi:sugar/nucleoside kinase (ribokinase family)
VPAVDVTGAGDVFNAAFIYGLLSAWDVRKIVRFAAWAGAAVCRELGGRKGIPTSEAVREFVHNDGQHS